METTEKPLIKGFYSECICVFVFVYVYGIHGFACIFHMYVSMHGETQTSHFISFITFSLAAWWMDECILLVFFPVFFFVFFFFCFSFLLLFTYIVSIEVITFRSCLCFRVLFSFWGFVYFFFIFFF